ncbi:MAG: VCBS repeat-containing protein [Patescibacteria group bacterium]|nr:VCBS repeat-containing protein [Patescibacteria group bacterium]
MQQSLPMRSSGVYIVAGLVALGFFAVWAMVPSIASAQSLAWTQSNEDGFGDSFNTISYSLVEYDDDLYTGVTNWETGAEVWRYDGSSWEQVNEDGFGDGNNVEAASVEVFEGMLYVGTVNDVTGTELWAYNGSSWEQVNEDGFGDPLNTMSYNLFIYDDILFTGTTNEVAGCEMWAYDGDAWSQVNEDGFGDANNAYCMSMQEYGSHLFIGTLRAAPGTGAELWEYDGTDWSQVCTDGFGNADNLGFIDVQVFDGQLFIGTRNSTDGGEVWAYDGTACTEVRSGGFGDGSNNYDVFSLVDYNHTLYAGTTNPTTGTELWAYDGSSWEQVNEDGFGHHENFSSSMLTTIGGVLYVGTAGMNSGTEIWETSLPDGVGPVASEQSPAGGDRGVDPRVAISFTLTDAVYDVDSATLGVSVAGHRAVSAGQFEDGYFGTVTANEDGSLHVVINSSSGYGYGTPVAVSVTVSDARGNASTPSWEFTTTADRPSLGIVMSPASKGGPNVRVVDEAGAQISSFFVYDQSLRMGLEVAQADIDADSVNEIVVTPGQGVESRIKAFELDGTEIASTLAFNEGFTGGVTVATGDFDGDDREDIAVAPISAGGPNVRIYSLNAAGDGLDLTDWFFAYDAAFRGGVNVVAGDLDGDSIDEIITAPRGQGGPDVRVFKYSASRGEFELTTSVMAYQSAYHGGVQLGTGDINGDGADDVIVSPYLNGGPNIRVYTVNADGDLELLTWVMAYQDTYRGTLSMSVGDVNGDGKGEITLVPQSLGGPNVRIYRYENNSLALMDWFMAYDEAFRGGVNLFLADVDGDGIDEVMTSPASLGGPNVRVYDMESGTRVLKSWFWAFPEGFRGGVNFGK